MVKHDVRLENEPRDNTVKGCLLQTADDADDLMREEPSDYRVYRQNIVTA